MIHRFSDSESEAYAERQPRGILGMLFRHRVPVLIGLGVLLIAAITLVIILPRQFQSKFDILVRNKLPLSARLSATSQETVDEQRMQSELALLHSPELAAKVVDPDSPTQPDATHTAADIARHQAAVALFSQQLITSVAPNSNIIHVVVTAGDPHRAAELSSRLLDVFFASQSEVDRPTPATAFFIAESNHAKDAWQQAQLALDTFRLAHPPTPVGSAAEISLQIAALNHQIQRNDEQIDATIGRILTGERKLVTIPARPLDSGNKSRSASMPLLSTAQLNAMLAIYTDEQAILLTQPPTDSEAVRASLSLAGQVADTNTSLKIARQATAPERDPAANSLWQSTTEEITQAGSELKGLYATRVSLANQLAAFQTNLDTIQHPPATLASLQGKAASLQGTYRLAEQRANEARIADAMDQQLRLNVAVASRPSYSNTATSPSPWLYGATIALFFLFLAACLTLFAGMYSSEHEELPEDEYDYEEEDASSSANYVDEYAKHFVGAPEEDPQQQIPFPSRIRSAASGAFLYAAPGSTVPNPVPEADESPFPDLLHEPLRHAPPLSEILSQAIDPAPRPAPAAETTPVEPEPEVYPAPPAEIFHPNQYQPTAAPVEHLDGVDDEASFPRPASGEPRTVVPSFFAGPPSGAVVYEKNQEEEREERPVYTSYNERMASDPPAVPPNIEPTPVVAAPFAAAPFAAAPFAAAPFAAAPFAAAPLVEPPVAASEAEASTVPTAEPEPIVTLPDPTPPWSHPVVPEPKPSPLPPLSYWAANDETAPELVAITSEPEPEPASVEPTMTASVPLEPVPSEPVDPPFKPLYTESAYIPPPAAAMNEVYTAPVNAAPQPPAPQPIGPPVEPRALPQSFTSTVRPAPFLTSVSSTLSAPAFRFSTPPPRPFVPPPVVAAPKPPVPAPERIIPPVAAVPAPEPQLTRPVEPVSSPEPELVVSYASHPIELVPDPVLPPVKPLYQAQRQAPAPQPPPADNDLADFPLYRAPKPAQTPVAAVLKATPSAVSPEPESGTIQTSARPQTYEEMVRALVFPEEFAPYVPPARPTPAPPRPPAAEFIPEPRPIVPPPTVPPTQDDDAPPFFYARKSAPPAPEPVYPRQEAPEAIQNFIRRPSVPLQPAPGHYDDRTIYRPAETLHRDDPAPYRPAETPQRDDRTTYHPIASAPQPPQPSWIDIAPPPAPRGEALDPQKRNPDRISAIRDSGPRSFPVTDQSGVRLTPSQRMKRSRLQNPDKDDTRY